MNRHLKVAFMVAPFLALLGYIGADYYYENEAGKSNLFEALYGINPFDIESDYNIDEDWPVDKWVENDDEALVHDKGSFRYYGSLSLRQT